MHLFDDIVRHRQIPMSFRTTHFEGLNECADPQFENARALAEGWFQRLPHREQADIWRRFRSKNDGQHQAALFELYLHELLLRMGYEIEHHPEMAPGVGHRPDFLVSRLRTPLFYLEATTTAHPESVTKNEKRLEAVHDALNAIDCPDYWLSVLDLGGLDRAQKLQPLCRAVEKWVKSLASDLVSESLRTDGDYHTFLWVNDGWRLRVAACPKPREFVEAGGSRPLGASSGRWRFVDPEGGILRALHSKAVRYGEPGLPLVVAVNTLDDCRRESDQWSALDREWRKLRRPGYRRVSAALLAWLPVAIAAPHETPLLVHHPDPTRSLPSDLWLLPQAALGERAFIRTANVGRTAPDLLGLRETLQIGR